MPSHVQPANLKPGDLIVVNPLTRRRKRLACLPTQHLVLSVTHSCINPMWITLETLPCGGPSITPRAETFGRTSTRIALLARPSA